MARYLLKRLGQSLLTVFLTVTTVFVLLRLPGGDIAYNYAPPNPTPAQLDTVRRAFGLDQSVLSQYWTFLTNLVQGNVGDSFKFKQSALTVVLDRLPYTITLAVAAIVVTAIVAIPLGVWMARRNNTARETTGEHLHHRRPVHAGLLDRLHADHRVLGEPGLVRFVRASRRPRRSCCRRSPSPSCRSR